MHPCTLLEYPVLVCFNTHVHPIIIMELTTIKDAFERAIKKQKLSASKSKELIDGMLLAVEQAMKEIQAIPDEGASSSQKSVLMELKSKLNEIAPVNQLEAYQKDLAIALGKYGKLLEETI
ncbi:hypothetical protein J5N97_016786 [Dioscorea zingiberensis]|uniref:Uncharacterized protein n=1 Tax=Dioscorea zingiberensis TaxID=325984 RepID=A0A9D5HFI5_9LILI|nr:hypothetical protein J5N97_016786 [Dioscorea zingiberensis]